MAIKLETPESALRKFLEFSQQTMFNEIQRGFSYLGEQCVTRVRDRSSKDSWIDRTGNLRSSIGYAVYNNGVTLIKSAFNQVKNGSEGVNAGENMVEKLAKQYSDTFALVVLAGMSYAEKVEALDSKDVLASTELWAKTKVEEYLNKSVERAIKKINNYKL